MRQTAWVCLAAALVFAPWAFGDTILLTDQTFESGTGFGNVANLLTLQNTGEEHGAITPSGGTTDSVKDTSRIYSVAELKALGLTPDNLALVFNINEPGAVPASMVDLLTFGLNFFNSSGTPILSEVDCKNCTENGIGLAPVASNGTGTAGYVLTYSNTGMLATFFANDTNLLGATASIRGSAAGPENFYLIRNINGANGSDGTRAEHALVARRRPCRFRRFVPTCALTSPAAPRRTPFKFSVADLLDFHR
jgi:hypothetical protein